MNKRELFKGYIFYYILVMIMFLANSLGIVFINGKIAFVLAISWIVISLVLYYLMKNNQRSLILYAVLNAIISGVSMSSYYVLKKIEPPSPILLLGFLAIIMILHYVIINKLKDKKIFLKMNMVLTILSMIASMYIWLVHSATYGSGFIFVYIIFLCINIALFINNEKEVSYIVIIGFASLIMFGGILISIIVALTEGEALELMDIGPWDRKKNR